MADDFKQLLMETSENFSEWVSQRLADRGFRQWIYISWSGVNTDPDPNSDFFRMNGNSQILVWIKGIRSIDIRYRKAEPHGIKISVSLLHEAGLKCFNELVAAIGEEWELEPQRAKSEHSDEESAIPPIRREPRLVLQVKTTVTHYAHTVLHINQDIAAQRVDTSDKTYRTYRDNGWLLSEDEFKRRTEKSVAEYWKDATGG